jgi:hypothetical protein
MKDWIKGFLSIAMVGGGIAVHAESQFPLRMDIDVSARRNTREVGAGKEGQAKVENVSLRVRIRRASGSANAQPLTAELYVIGRQIHTGYYGIIDVVKKDFSFAEEREFEFTTREYALGRTGGNINVGGTYETFLVVVADENGEVLDHRSGRVIREQGIQFIREQGPKTLFDRDGNVVGKVDEKNSAFKKAVPAATNPGSDDD